MLCNVEGKKNMKSAERKIFFRRCAMVHKHAKVQVPDAKAQKLSRSRALKKKSRIESVFIHNYVQCRGE